MIDGRTMHGGKARSFLSHVRRPLYAIAGYLGLALGGSALALPILDSAQAVDYQASGNVPVAWRDFAARVRLQFRDQLLADSEPVRRINRLLDERGATESNPLNVVVMVWITSSGVVDRIRFVSLDEDLISGLRSALVGSDLRREPPPGMLQPMHIRLSLGRAN